MKTSRRKSTGGRGARRGTTEAGRPTGADGARPHTWPDLQREDDHPEPYRPELVARLEQAVREGRYAPDPTAIAAAIDRMDALLG